jgi:hypothetical protein
MSGFTRSQSSFDTVHDLIALMAQDTMNASFNSRYYLRIRTYYHFRLKRPPHFDITSSYLRLLKLC